MNKKAMAEAFEELSEFIKSQEGFFRNTRQGEDGLVYCTVCGVCKQHFDTFIESWVWCTCKCEQDRDKAEKARMKGEADESFLEELRRNSGVDEKKTWTFANDDGKNAAIMSRFKKYVENWDEVYRRNLGLLLYGGVGTGKTFAAYCIANALLSKGVSVKVTDFPTIINAFSSSDVSDKNAYLYSLTSADLLVIDDLGTERQTEYALQIIEQVINKRTEAKKPIIITTNLKPEEFKNPENVAQKRIYSRIVEMTTPILINGADRRAQASKSKQEELLELIALDGFEEII